MQTIVFSPGLPLDYTNLLIMEDKYIARSGAGEIVRGKVSRRQHQDVPKVYIPESKQSSIVYDEEKCR